MRFLILLLAVMAAAMADEKELLKLHKDGIDGLTFKMLGEVQKKNQGKSVIMSAYSLLPPLTQLALASEGDAQKELLDAVGYPTVNATKEVLSLIKDKTHSIKGVDLQLAAKIFVAKNYKLHHEFSSVAKEYFSSEVTNIDFNKNDEAAKEINTWVEDHTNKHITDLVDPSSLNTDTRVLLVNAIYFKGTWKTQFKEQNTKERDFHVNSQKVIKVPTMYQKSKFLYGESTELDAKLLELPYEGEEASLLIVLPNKVDGLEALTTKLQNRQALDEAYDKMYKVDVEVYLPKFKIETKINLKDVLTEIGVKQIFNAGNSGLVHVLDTNESIYVSEAIQKAYIEVNEEGATAAAANEFGVAYLSAIVTEMNALFNANHPFVFYLKTQDMLLFEGVYYE